MPGKLKTAIFLNEYTEKIFERVVEGLDMPGDQTIEVTHELRKGLKRIRALVKLIRHKHPDKTYSETNVLLRNWGRIFSDLRDAHVRTHVLEQLRELSDFESVESDLIRLSDKNNKEISAMEESLLTREKKFAWIKQELESTRKISNYFKVTDLTGKDVKAGLKNSFQKSFESYQLVQKHHHPEDLHEWRKRLKDFQYQLEFFDRIGQIKPYSQLELSVEINEYLGTDQDYFNLSLWLMYHIENFSSKTAYSFLIDEIKHLRSDQQELAFKKAERLYSD